MKVGAKIINILMVDDHPLIIDGYKNALASAVYEGKTLSIDVAHDCDQALEHINKATYKNSYDLALIDLQLPPSKMDSSIIAGDGVAAYLRKEFPKTKIVILTMHGERSRIFNVINTLNPEGFLVKSDLSSSELLLATQKIMNGGTYFSETVTSYFLQRSMNDFKLDERDMQILFHLSKGVLTKNLVKHVPLSLSSIEKRKNIIKEKFQLIDANDEQLIDEARRRGFL